MAELGWTGLALPEEWGGQGLGIVELAVALRGDGLRARPLAAVLQHGRRPGARALRLRRPDASASCAPLAAGEKRGTPALLDAGSPATIGELHDGGQGRRRRRRPRRREGPGAGRRRRRLLPRRDQRRPPPPGRERGRRASRVDARAVDRPHPPLLLGPLRRRRGRRRATPCPATSADYYPVFHRVCVALAAESTGIAQRTMEMAVEYAKDRQQFGRPIGSYQAVSHRCAQMLLETENARSAVYGAAWAADAEPGVAAAGRLDGEGLRLRRRLAGRRRLDPGPRRHRLHLGARPPLLPQARPRSNAAIFGDAKWHRERVADAVLAQAPARAGRGLSCTRMSALDRISVAAIGNSVADLEAEAQRAEAAGVECVWAPELFRSVGHPGRLPGREDRADRRRHRDRLGLHPQPLHPSRSPRSTSTRCRAGASGSASGAGVKRLNETWHNADYGKPAPHLREAIEATRLIMQQAGAGEPIRYEGEYYDIDIKGWIRPASGGRASRCRSTPPRCRRGWRGWPATSPTA